MNNQISPDGHDKGMPKPIVPNLHQRRSCPNGSSCFCSGACFGPPPHALFPPTAEELAAIHKETKTVADLLREQLERQATGKDKVVTPLPVPPPASAEKCDGAQAPADYYDGTKALDEMVRIWGKPMAATWCEMTAYKYIYRMGRKAGNAVAQEREKAMWYMATAQRLRRDVERPAFKPATPPTI